MLCPFCLHEVPQFELREGASFQRGDSVEPPVTPAGTPPDGVPPLDPRRTVYCCPVCNQEDVPYLYLRDYQDYPSLPISVIGMVNHGKTVFLRSLLHELEQVGARWPGFHMLPLDEEAMREFRDHLGALEDGQLPNRTNRVFPRAQIIRLHGIPRVGGMNLLLFDTSGEAFSDVRSLQDCAHYVYRSPTVVWLLSLIPEDLDSHFPPTDFLSVYYHALASNGSNTRDQDLIICLTKGDLLLQRGDFPPSLRDFLLHDDLDPRKDAWQRLEALSRELETWLAAAGHHGLVNAARSLFRSVHFCVVSALGVSATQGQLLNVAPMPRGILAPLFFLFRADNRTITVDTTTGSHLYYSLDEAIGDIESNHHDDGSVAPDGSTLPLRVGIRLGPGVYHLRKPIKLNVPLTLAGQGVNETRIVGTFEGCLAECSANGRLALNDVTLEKAGPTSGDVVCIHRGEFVFQRVRFQGGRGEPGQKTGGHGLLVLGESVGRLDQCEALANEGEGISLRDRSTVMVQSSTLTQNGRSGIAVLSKVRCSLRNNTSLQNGLHGIHVGSDSAPAIEGNQCASNRRSGILLADKSRPLLRKNQCLRNGHDGIQVTDTSEPDIHDNGCLHNRGNGIGFYDSTTGRALDNLCKDNRLSGICISDNANPTLEDNRVALNEECGLCFEEQARGTALGNRCEENGLDGILLSDSSRPALENNVCTNNDNDGLSIGADARPTRLHENHTNANRHADLNDQRPFLVRWRSS